MGPMLISPTLVLRVDLKASTLLSQPPCEFLEQDRGIEADVRDIDSL